MRTRRECDRRFGYIIYEFGIYNPYLLCMNSICICYIYEVYLTLFVSVIYIFIIWILFVSVIYIHYLDAVCISSIYEVYVKSMCICYICFYLNSVCISYIYEVCYICSLNHQVYMYIHCIYIILYI